MIEAADQPDSRAEPPRRAASMRRSTALAIVAAFAIVIWGGYGRHWSWTGINGKSATLWDWLNLLMLPIAVAVLPLWLSRRTRVGRRHKAIGLSLFAAFAVLVVAGYTIPWGWTGFTGNKLWDWLELLVLPLTVAFIPLALELRDSWTTRHSFTALALLVAFTVVVVGGYLGDWAWTGFHGNTLWNWLHLWLLPLVIPLLIIVWLRPLAMSGVVTLNQDQEPESRAVSGGARTVAGEPRSAPAGEERETE